MIPWLLVAELISTKQKTLSTLVGERIQEYPCSGEINYKVDDAQASIASIKLHYAGLNPNIDNTDGISLEFSDWRLNLRSSNTEPLLRLNVESRADVQLVRDSIAEIEAKVQGAA